MRSSTKRATSMMHTFPLKQRMAIAEGTTAFLLDTHDSGYTFQAGQNADFTLENPPYTDDEGNTRTFSLAASPLHRDTIMFATRTRPTAFKRSLLEIPLGSMIKVTPASGTYLLPKSTNDPIVFIAGGIGITPIRSMIEWATQTKRQQRLTLLYSNRTPALTAFLPELEQWSRENPNFVLIPTITESSEAAWPYERGRIDATFLKKHVADTTSALYYISGPPKMVTAMRMMLLEMGIANDHIITESFTGY